MEATKTNFNKVMHVFFNIIMYVCVCLVFLPCLLTFTQVGDSISVWNFVGIAYTYLLYRIFKKLTK